MKDNKTKGCCNCNNKGGKGGNVTDCAVSNGPKSTGKKDGNKGK